MTEFNVTDLSPLKSHSEFITLVERYRHRPEWSLVPPVSRAFLHFWISRHRPTAILEIGTYRAGTTRVLAEALSELADTSSRGKIVTVDVERMAPAEELVAGWPPSAASLVDFRIANSMSFFSELFVSGESEENKFDMIFIDGNHDYEFVYFDLLASARALRPGGILILDNVDQPGPAEAARDFLAENPEWIDVDSAVANWAASQWMSGPVPILGESSFFALVSPREMKIGRHSRSFNRITYDSSRITGFALTAAAAASGRLKAIVYSRAFRTGRIPEECKAVIIHPIARHANAVRMNVALEEPLECAIEAGPGTTYYLQINLSFHPDQGSGGLQLLSNPEFLR
jgi:predicted O-methyltransferase YrrM